MVDDICDDLFAEMSVSVIKFEFEALLSECLLHICVLPFVAEHFDELAIFNGMFGHQ